MMAICIYSVNFGSQTKNNVLLLTTNTEVSIAPKLHRSQGPTPSSASSSSKSRVTTSQTNGGPAKEANVAEDEVRRNVRILRVLPKRLLRRPFSEYTGAELIAYVSPSAFSKLKPFHEFNNNRETIVCFQMALKRLPPPIDPLTTSPIPSTSTPRILKPETTDRANGVDGQQDGASGSIFVGWVDDIPKNHIVFPALPDGVEEWDLVQSVGFGFETVVGKSHSYAIPDCALQMIPKQASNCLSTAPLLILLYRELVVSLRQHTSNAVTFHPAETFSLTFIKSTAPTSVPLAGVDEILQRCTEFCLRKFAEHSSVNVVHGGKFQQQCNVGMITSTGSCFPPSHWTLRCWEDFHCSSHSKICPGGR